MNDTNGCLEEGMGNLIKIKEFQDREARGERLSAEESKNMKQLEGQCK